ncbi:hypothetical protein [Actinotalea solisilvae]|uniref:hypothetical protein n=1 Tax=Actinotalea solisilvae TaxID=2072922 RepID=UPI0018F232E9|nr:hypothetical protein [Actinotalea solisilvae]
MSNRQPVESGSVAEMVRELAELRERQFVEAFSENVGDERRIETQAFRSPELAVRSLTAARQLVDNVNSAIRAREGESNKQWQRRAEGFRAAVGRERRLLEAIVAGLRAQEGVLPAAPNPRARAFRELARNHPEEYVRLVRKHQREVVEEARARKAERRLARQAAAHVASGRGTAMDGSLASSVPPSRDEGVVTVTYEAPFDLFAEPTLFDDEISTAASGGVERNSPRSGGVSAHDRTKVALEGGAAVARASQPSRATKQRLPRLLKAEIASEARAEVHRLLDGVVDDRARLEVSRAVVDEAECLIPGLRDRRDALLVSLSVFEEVRGVSHVAGLGRTQVAKIKGAAIGGGVPVMAGTKQAIDHDAQREMARERGFERIEDSFDLLPVVARELTRLEARSAAARAMRDEAALALVDRGALSQSDVAAAMGVTASRLSHVTRRRSESDGSAF